MERTREEVAQRALRLIAVCAADEAPTADMMVGALDVLDSVWAEAMDEARAPWDVVTGVPAAGFVPLANLLAAELSGEYGVAAPMTRARAKLRLLAVIRPAIRWNDCDTPPCADYGAMNPIPTPPPPIIPTAWTDATPWVDAAAWDDSIQWSI